ncbi:hypothetical protein AMJ80_07370 [bacterium SM23_31]|nr:MAG: hypothetical protein AMJ80_07370 [bacterium SM23_31]
MENMYQYGTLLGFLNGYTSFFWLILLCRMLNLNAVEKNRQVMLLRRAVFCGKFFILLNIIV